MTGDRCPDSCQRSDTFTRPQGAQKDPNSREKCSRLWQVNKQLLAVLQGPDRTHRITEERSNDQDLTCALPELPAFQAGVVQGQELQAAEGTGEADLRFDWERLGKMLTSARLEGTPGLSQGRPRPLRCEIQPGSDKQPVRITFQKETVASVSMTKRPPTF